MSCLRSRAPPNRFSACDRRLPTDNSIGVSAILTFISAVLVAIFYVEVYPDEDIYNLRGGKVRALPSVLAHLPLFLYLYMIGTCTYMHKHTYDKHELSSHSSWTAQRGFAFSFAWTSHSVFFHCLCIAVSC